jgi:hypothetical protein
MAIESLATIFHNVYMRSLSRENISPQKLQGDFGAMCSFWNNPFSYEIDITGKRDDNYVEKRLKKLRKKKRNRSSDDFLNNT